MSNTNIDYAKDKLRSCIEEMYNQELISIDEYKILLEETFDSVDLNVDEKKVNWNELTLRFV